MLIMTSYISFSFFVSSFLYQLSLQVSSLSMEGHEFYDTLYILLMPIIYFNRLTCFQIKHISSNCILLLLYWMLLIVSLGRQTLKNSIFVTILGAFSP